VASVLAPLVEEGRQIELSGRGMFCRIPRREPHQRVVHAPPAGWIEPSQEGLYKFCCQICCQTLPDSAVSQQTHRTFRRF